MNWRFQGNDKPGSIPSCNSYKLTRLAETIFTITLTQTCFLASRPKDQNGSNGSKNRVSKRTSMITLSLLIIKHPPRKSIFDIRVYPNGSNVALASGGLIIIGLLQFLVRCNPGGRKVHTKSFLGLSGARIFTLRARKKRMSSLTFRGGQFHCLAIMGQIGERRTQ